MKKRVGILGATGTVGQRLISLLANHPQFSVTALAASERSAGKTLETALAGRWKMAAPMPAGVAQLIVANVNDIVAIKSQCDFVFCAIDLDKQLTQELETGYAKADVPVVSCNSAHRWTEDVPMIIPEVNPDHLQLIKQQRSRLQVKRGFIVVKPNCSIQSYVPAFAALREFQPSSAFVTTYQAISGSGKSLKEAPEIIDNIIPLPGEEEKSEREPLRILGTIKDKKVELANMAISAHCNRVPTEDGHYVAVSVAFAKKPTRDQVLEAWKKWRPESQTLQLPSAPAQALYYREEQDRPQTRLDRDLDAGMGFSLGRLRECPVLHYRFSALSHNTIRGAAGGAILTAELLLSKEYL